MDYLLCIPPRENSTRESCEKVHNILARMSDKYKLRIVPEPVKNKQFPCPDYFKKYRIYKPVRERDANGEAYLQKEEEEMILIQSGEDLNYILSETYGFEFYITDKQCSYLLCFSDHDILYGCGTAKEWIERIKKKDILNSNGIFY